MIEHDQQGIEFLRTPGDDLAEFNADVAAASGKWSAFGGGDEVMSQADAILDGQVVESVTNGLDVQLDNSPESKSTINPEETSRKRKELGDEIIYLANGGDTLPNTVVRGSIRTPKGDELVALRTASGHVLSVTLKERKQDGTIVNSQLSEPSLGMPRDLITIYALSDDGLTRRLSASMGTTEGENYGELDGEASQWPSDRTAPGYGTNLDADQSAALIKSTIDHLQQKVAEVKSTTKAA